MYDFFYLCSYSNFLEFIPSLAVVVKYTKVRQVAESKARRTSEGSSTR